MNLKFQYYYFFKRSIFICFFILSYQPAIGQLDSLFWDTLSFVNIAPHRDEGLVRSTLKHYITEDKQGVLWICTNLGIFRYDGYEAINFSQYLLSKFSDFPQLSNNPNEIIFDNFNNLWIGTNKGLLVYDFELDEIKVISLGRAINPQNHRNFVEHLDLIDDQLYISTRNGLVVIDTPSEKIINQYFNNGREPSGRATIYGMRSALPLNDSLLYTIGSSGIHKINKKTDSVELFKAPFRVPTEHWFYESILRKDSFWMGSWGSGLVSFNLKTNQFSNYKVVSPFDPNRKWANFTQLEEVNDTMFIATLEIAGLGAYDIKNHQYFPIPELFKPYTDVGNPRSVFIDSKGYAWVGRPYSFLRSKIPVRAPNSKDFNLSVTKVSHHKQELIRPDLVRSNSFDLDEFTSKQISISLAVSHQELIKDSLNFRYRVNYQVWTELGKEQIIRLNNLNAGKNKIYIQALLANKILDETTYTLNVKIPFYKQTWFWMLLLTFAVLLSYVWYVRKIKRLKKEQAIVLDYEKQLARLETMALRSQMNPHFIFNSVNSIKGLIITDKKEEASDQLTRFAKFMRNILNYSDKDLITLADELKFLEAYCKLEQFKKSKFIDFQVHLDPDIDQYEILIPPFLLQPFLENSFKYAFNDSKIKDAAIKISMSQNDGFLKVQISDNGIGIRANKVTGHLSKGINIVKKRLELRNEMEDNLKVIFNGYCQGTNVDLKIKIDD